MHAFTFVTYAAAALTAGLASAAHIPRSNGVPIADIVIDRLSGGTRTGSETICVPIGRVYTNPKALAEVSTLSLKSTTGASLDSVRCTPFKNTDGTGSGGLPFTKDHPSYLSTNLVQVGSIVCLIVQ